MMTHTPAEMDQATQDNQIRHHVKISCTKFI